MFSIYAYPPYFLYIYIFLIYTIYIYIYSLYIPHMYIFPPLIYSLYIYIYIPHIFPIRTVRDMGPPLEGPGGSGGARTVRATPAVGPQWGCEDRLCGDMDWEKDKEQQKAPTC